MSVYILFVNVIHSLFTDKIHTIYMLWKKENFSSDYGYLVVTQPKVATSLLTSCNNLLQQADIRMDAFAWLATAVNRLVASCQQTC